ncbi:hypothetical protein BEH94_10710 [Candidatus Altiarchaeales archaeon WOR_SM1_SCG]|nr:hypothetical protein BEH94_10710 [Candidatus Altiarchaeales archaeon WOR_SM1_SCG]
MGKSKKNNGCDEYHKFQKARSICIHSFDKQYKKSKDSEEALQKALNTAKITQKKLNLTQRHFAGLEGEVIFYGKYDETLDFDLLPDTKKTHADFHSPITQKYYDVTTNIDYKDLGKYIRDENREYLLSCVDRKSREVELIPTSFPKCPNCSSPAHYVVYLDDTKMTTFDSFCDYPYQVLKLYCCNCQYSEELKTLECGLNDPYRMAYEELECEYYLNISYPNNKEKLRTLDKRMDDLIKGYWFDILKFCKKEFDVFISAISRMESEMFPPSKNDFYEYELPVWRHPILDFDKYKGKDSREFYFPDYEMGLI